MFNGARILLLLQLPAIVLLEKCYSCSSPKLQHKWPKNETTNELLYLENFPFFANVSCELIKGAIPVVDCTGSVCFKAVIKEPPVERTVCETGGAIVRGCWSDAMQSADKIPLARKNMIRMTQTADSNDTVGVIYTCDGFLCNSTVTPTVSLLFSIFSLLFVFIAFPLDTQNFY